MEVLKAFQVASSLLHLLLLLLQPGSQSEGTQGADTLFTPRGKGPANPRPSDSRARNTCMLLKTSEDAGIVCNGTKLIHTPSTPKRTVNLERMQYVRHFSKHLIYIKSFNSRKKPYGVLLLLSVYR